ncbi:hypothetical protein DMB66_44655 [Actinoplanes sp. ATCC 53533]|uniref:DUF6528 family protein n=1 Tax=Actinoplanes sp. ATCC 53533 TaxID=1288362 RepID=UPI000F76CD5F|nr:DUF6528 family protein [Actinoplanes sp. ATCC 53533]RSM49765.1 hypothetical protein DMB66_44655 [Actinoplanes sp. ATCC 53533]
MHVRSIAQRMAGRARRLGVLAVTVGVGLGAGVAAVLAAPAPASAASGFVAIVDQRNGILVFNLASSRWSGRAKWTFKPTGPAWKNLSDVRFRKYGGRTTVLVTASGGMAATVDYKTHKVTWKQNVGGNPHAMELLPTGAVVVASSKTGRLTAYGKGRHTGRSVAFPDAHAVVWNAASGRLWALGGTALCSYAVRGTATAPRLAGKSCVRAPKGGHDLAQVQGAPSKLWFSSKSHVYQYDINSRTGARAAGYIDNAKIKSVGNQPGGLVITTQVKGANADGTWGNGNVWLYNQNGSYAGNRYRAGAAIYKARPVVWEAR